MRSAHLRFDWSAVALAAVAACSPAVRAEPPRVYALKAGTVVVAPGRVLEGATVVLRDGLIEAVGTGVAPPADAVEIDLAGAWVYPGLIDPDTELGLQPERGESGPGPGSFSEMVAQLARSARPQSLPGAVHPLPLIRPEARARDQLLPFDNDERRGTLKRYRELGFTLVLSRAERGIFRGRSAAILLQEDRPVPELIVRDDVAQHVAFERSRSGEGYPTSLMGAVAAFRQTLLDAQRFQIWSERFARHPRGMRRPEFVAAYEALQPVLERRMPVFFHLGELEDAWLADRLAREFGLEAVLAGSGVEWEAAERLARTGRALIYPVAFPDKPDVEEEADALDVSLREMRRFVEAPAGPARLQQAGVRFAFTTRGLDNLGDFRRNLEQIVAAGLPEEAALAALTTVPAALLRLAELAGTLEPGKIANVVVCDGPLLHKETKIQRVFVDGVPYEIEQRAKPKGDPNAVVDPRGEWSVVFEMGGRSFTRTWTISGTRGAWRGTAETQAGTVDFERVALEGNALTVVLPGRGGFGAVEVTVIIEGDRFEGTAEMGPRTITVKGTRVRGPEGGEP